MMARKESGKVVKPETTVYFHSYLGKVVLPKLTFGDLECVKDLQAHLAYPTGNTQQVFGWHIMMGRNPFVAGKRLTEDEKFYWSLLVETYNQESLQSITFDTFKEVGLLEDTPINRDKFDQLFAARELGKSIFQR
ncbi:MAG: hypothetical protein K2Q12_07825 [Rickettsiales bacterium]|nr:hypothetical protein [Rickettsiales bacterium]